MTNATAKAGTNGAAARVSRNALLLISILVQGLIKQNHLQDVAENTVIVIVPAAMSGKTEVARNKFSTVPKVICIIVTVQWLVLRLAIWASMSR